MIANALVITPLARLIAPRSKPPELSAEELESLLDLSQRKGIIDADEERVLQQVLELSFLKVRDLMTPRVDLEAFDLDDGPGELRRFSLESGHDQLPVYRDSLDNVEGLVRRRDVLLHPPGSPLEMQSLIRPVSFVPEQQRADRLVEQFREMKSTNAIVVDEYGGTAGLVSLGDLVGHVVGGPSTDPIDGGQPEVAHIEGGAWSVDADLSINDWPDWFGRGTLPGGIDPRSGIRTIGGLVMAALGRLPDVGDEVTYANVHLSVEQMEGRRIRRVRITLDAAKPGGDA